MESMKDFVTVRVVNGDEIGTKWAYLDKRSTAMKITDFPLDVGNDVMKSLEMSSHIVASYDNG